MGGRDALSYKIATTEAKIVEQVVKCLCERFDGLVERYSKPECGGWYRDIEAGQVQMQSVQYAAMVLARTVSPDKAFKLVAGAV
jgi:hypothetical protein